MFEPFFKDKIAPLALRLALGSLCAYHGYVKIMANGGTTWTRGLSTFWQLVIAWGGFAAGLAILAGFRCRWAATVVLALTVGNLIWWEGWNIARLPIATLEPIFLVVVIGLALVFIGAGELSIDGRTTGRSSGGPRPLKKAG